MYALVLLAFFSFASGLLSNIKQTRLTFSLKSADPNFDAHLPSLLKVGLSERPSPDIASDLRKRYQKIGDTKRKAAKALTSNKELAIELEELADDLEETTENFVKLAETWDAWNRPSPDLPSQLRQQQQKNKQTQDPNFEAHLNQMYTKGLDDNRPNPDLPSELRLLKYKNMATVNKLAAKQLREAQENVELAAELEEIADEIEESHAKYVEIAAAIKNNKY